ncbi:MAG: DUF4199 domain-containing protein [Chitinophagaceae bacterium]
MEERKPMSHVRAGLLIAAAIMLISLIPMIAGAGEAKPGSGLLTYAAILAGLIINIFAYGRAKNGNVSFGELFSFGFKATAVYTIIFIGFLVLFSLLVPEFKSTALTATRAQMETGPQATQQQVEQNMAALEKYFWVFAIGGTTMVFVIIGAIGSLIGAAITKKNPPIHLDQSPT